MFSQSLIQIIYKTNPSTIYEERILPNPTRSDLNTNKFSFVMFMFDSATQNPVVDNSIFRLKATFMYKDISANNHEQTFKSKTMELQRCNSNSFQVAGTESYFLNLNYTNMYCFSNINNFYLNDPTNKVSCMEKKEKQAIISRSYLQVFYSTNVVKVINYNKPFQSIGVSSFWSLNMDYLNSVSMLYKKTYIEDDIRLFSSDIHTQSSLLKSSQNSQLQGKTGFSILEISMYLEKNKEQYFARQYMKIPKAFSEIGGIFNILFAVRCLLSYPQSQMQLNRAFFNSAFYINQMDDDEKDSQKSHKQEKYQKNNLDHNSSPINSKLKNNQTLFDSSPQMKEIYQNNKSVFRNKLHDIQVKTSEYVSYYFNCFNVFKQNDVSKTIHPGSQKLQNYTDVCFIINKLIEFEKLKTLVLNDQQLKLFNFIPKPQLDSQFLVEEQQSHENISPLPSQDNNPQNAQNTSQKDKIIESENSSMANPTTSQKQGHKKNQFNIRNIDNKSKVEKAKEAFNQIYKSNNKKSKVDLKLIEMLDQNLITLFQKNVFDDKQSQNIIESIQNSQMQQSKSKDYQYTDKVLEKTDQEKDLRFKLRIIKQFDSQYRKSNIQELSECSERFDTEIMNTTEPLFQIYKAQQKSFSNKIEKNQ
ncbi:hypothetical protein ABPG72_001814 [Tetrahymena utriculariae]